MVEGPALATSTGSSSSDEQQTGLGKPSSRQWVDYKDVLAFVFSLVCLVIAVFVVVATPRYKFPWQLGFKNQIVVIGVLLGFQNLCFKRVALNSFVLLEARYGKSVLQNYDGILRTDFLTGDLHLAWRAAIVVLTFLPMALGVAYKQFVGGTSSAPIMSNDFGNAKYGIAYPDLGQYSSYSNTIFLSMSANAGFLNASLIDQDYPVGKGFPWIYSYNTLVLSNDSAALLDMPLASYVDEIRGRLTTNETWDVTGSVDAIVATQNTSITSLRKDQAFLNQTMQHAYNGFASADLFWSDKGLGIGWISVGVPELGNSYCLMGTFGNQSVRAPSPTGLTRNTSDEGFLNFMESAQMFSIRRHGCHGSWRISQSNVKLLDGYCLNESAAGQNPSSEILHDGQTSPYAVDTLAVITSSIGVYSTTRPSSPWKQVSYAVAAANAWWARSAFLIYGSQNKENILGKYPETIYSSRNQTVISTKPTLNAGWRLYLVLAIFPSCTTLLFLSLLFFYKLPISTGFGLVSILAGIDPDSLHWARGAGLSGKLERQIGLEIRSEQVANRPDSKAEGSHRIRYILSGQVKQRIPKDIDRGQTYM